jgi:hypothetical protein
MGEQADGRSDAEVADVLARGAELRQRLAGGAELVDAGVGADGAAAGESGHETSLRLVDALALLFDDDDSAGGSAETQRGSARRRAEGLLPYLYDVPNAPDLADAVQAAQELQKNPQLRVLHRDQVLHPPAIEGLLEIYSAVDPSEPPPSRSELLGAPFLGEGERLQFDAGPAGRASKHALKHHVHQILLDAEFASSGSSKQSYGR